jgi:hypothetical protein
VVNPDPTERPDDATDDDPDRPHDVFDTMAEELERRARERARRDE